MKTRMRPALCLCLILSLLTGIAACSGGDKQEDGTSEPTTRDYTYSGKLEITTENRQESEPGESSQPHTDETHTQGQTARPGEETTLRTVLSITPAVNSRPTEAVNYVTVTIPEGATMDEVFAILEVSGVASFSALMNAALTVDFTYYPLIKAQRNTGRAFCLEGYLRPGSYTFAQNSKPEDAIGRLLRNMQSGVTESMRRQAANRGYSVDEVITIASIIEKDSGSKAEMTKISAVINNRLKQGMKLEMPSTIIYVDKSIKPYLQSDDEDAINKYNEYYNTFRCSGLPAGPICSPGSDALKAALNPAGLDYLYYCVSSSGTYYYASTQQEHEENLIKAGLTQPEVS